MPTWANLTTVVITLAVLGTFSICLLYLWHRGLQNAAQATCTANLAQIAFAMNIYVDRYGCYPPPYLADASGRPMHSWRILLAETLDPELYARYRFEEPWDGPNNRALSGRMPPYYRCPNEGRRGASHPSYVMVVGADAVARSGATSRPADVADISSQTMLIVEYSGIPFNWLAPRDLDLEAASLNPGVGRLISRDPTGPGVVYADFTVARIAKAQITPKLLRSLGTRAGGG